MDKYDVLLLIVVSTLAIVILSVVAVMLIGLFDTRVDNKEVFAIIGPALHTTVGAFVGILSTKALDVLRRRKP